MSRPGKKRRGGGKRGMRMKRETSAGGVVFRAGEDGPLFLLIRDSYGHWGFPKGHVERGERSDAAALREVMDDAEDGEVTRGGSTITQQVAKNLFLWPGRSVVRKALELPLSLWIDLVLGKQRVLEIYLNIAELGPSGQFGVEAGSQYAFGRSVVTLSPREAALMAAILPNPVRRSARNPGPGVRRLAGTYTARAQASALQRCWSENRGF